MRGTARLRGLEIAMEAAAAAERSESEFPLGGGGYFTFNHRSSA